MCTSLFLTLAGQESNIRWPRSKELLADNEMKETLYPINGSLTYVGSRACNLLSNSHTYLVILETPRTILLKIHCPIIIVFCSIRFSYLAMITQ